VDVSPSPEEIATRRIFLGGFGYLFFRDGPVPMPCTGVHDGIWARTMVVTSSNRTVAITVIDSIGISNVLLDQIRRGSSEQTGIPIENIMVGVTHTHSGPDLQGLWGYVTDSYEQFVVNGTIESIVNAYKSRVPAKLYASGAVGYAFNRRDWGYTDTEITVLDAHRESDGSRIGTLINFASHPVALWRDNTLASSDWIHYTRATAEARLGAPVIYSQGAEGDVNPVLSGPGDNWDRASYYGNDIGNLAVDSIPSQIEVQDDLYVATEYLAIEVTNNLFKLAIMSGVIDYYYEGGPIAGFRITTRFSYIRFGQEVQGCAYPGESLTRNAEPMKGAMFAKHKFFLGLSGDALGYFVPFDEWESGRNGGYEESVSTNPMAGDWGRDIVIGLIRADNQ